MSLNPDIDMTEDQIAELEEQLTIESQEGNGENEGDPFVYEEEEPEELNFD